MAYLNLLAVVAPDQVERLRTDVNYRLKASRVAAVSHLLGSSGWVPVQPLVSLLAEALDGGEELCTKLWHPLRSPRYHRPEAVRDLVLRLDAAWDATLAGVRLDEDEWYRLEIGRLIKLFNEAATRSEGVASILNPPFDKERANRVVVPVEFPGKTVDR